MQTIQVVDPLNLTVLANITSDQYGLPLTNEAGGKNVSKLWNDAVFVQVGKRHSYSYTLQHWQM